MNWFSIVVSFLYTMILYGFGPLLFALLRKKPVTKGKVRAFSILYSFSAWLCSNLFWALYAGDSVSSGGAALFWGWIFYKLLKIHLCKTKRLAAAASSIPTSRCQAQAADTGKPVADSDTSDIEELIPEAPPELKPSNTNNAGEPMGGTSAVHPAELPVFQTDPPVERNAPRNRRYKAAVAVLSVVCVILVISTVLLGYFAATTRAECLNLERAVSDLISQNEKSQEEIGGLVEERDALSQRLDSVNERLNEVIEPYDLLQDTVGFIVSGSKCYHHCDCRVYRHAKTYQAHNIEYCKALGYVPCPECWKGSHGRLVDLETGDPIVPKRGY